MLLNRSQLYTYMEPSPYEQYTDTDGEYLI